MRGKKFNSQEKKKKRVLKSWKMFCQENIQKHMLKYIYKKSILYRLVDPKKKVCACVTINISLYIHFSFST